MIGIKQLLPRFHAAPVETDCVVLFDLHSQIYIDLNQHHYLCWPPSYWSAFRIERVSEYVFENWSSRWD